MCGFVCVGLVFDDWECVCCCVGVCVFEDVAALHAVVVVGVIVCWLVCVRVFTVVVVVMLS